MSNWGDENYDGTANSNNQNGENGIRQYIKSLEDQNKELNTKLTSFLEDQQNQKLDAVFESLGIAGARTLYSGDPDPAKITEWATSMKQVFGGTPQVAPATPEPNAPTLTPEVQNTFQGFIDAGSEGAPVGRYEQAESAIKGKSPDEILALWTGGNI